MPLLMQLYTIPALLLLLSLQSSATTHILFLGLAGEGAPAIERSFDRALRDRIATVPEITTSSFDESQRYRRMLDIDRTPTISETQLNALDAHLPDSVFIVWGQVKKLSIAPERKNLFRIELKGELQTSLTIYSLSYKRFTYRGSIRNNAEKLSGFILFSPINLETVSAGDREMLTGVMIENAAKECTNIIDSLCQGNLMEQEKNEPRADTAKEYQPSISDVFTVPSVEAAEISGKTAPSKSTPEKTGK